MRHLFFLSGDILLITAAMLGAVAMASGELQIGGYYKNIGMLVILAVAAKIPFLHWFQLYRISWSYVSTREIVSVIRAITAGSVALGILIWGLNWAATGSVLPPLQLSLLDFLFTLILLGGFRSAKRLVHAWGMGNSVVGEIRVLLVGAGDAGEQVTRRLQDAGHSTFRAVALVDDDGAKHGAALHNVPIIAGRKAIPKLVSQLKIDEMWITMPSCSASVVRDTVELGRKSGLDRIKIVPGLDRLLDGQVYLGDVRQLQLEDLLGRETVRIDTQHVQESIQGKRVLVTGAAGSIGAELCRQIAKFEPSSVVILDQDESRLFDIHRLLSQQFPGIQFQDFLANVCDKAKIGRVFRIFRPQIVFHAAAYKHVPLMEAFPEEAVKTNVLGTRVVGEAAALWGAEKFVLISTDKAVNPSSIMGATKRAAELIIQGLDQRHSTRFVAVRFGNVLGSRGSVVLTFQEQIARGGPVTVTDPEMKRYFMTVEESVMLVLQAETIAEGGSVMVLDMGEPVKIVDMARHLIRLSGLEPDLDIPITFTGIRPGEKLFEDLLTAEEGTVSTQHERVFVAKITSALSPRELEEHMSGLDRAIMENSREKMVSELMSMVPMHQIVQERAVSGEDQYDRIGSLYPDELQLLRQATNTCEEQPVLLAMSLVNRGAKRVAILGLSSTDNHQPAAQSPTLRISQVLRECGVEVKVHDPYYTEQKIMDVWGMETFQYPEGLGDFDTVLVVSGHPGYGLADHNQVLQYLTNCQVVLDNAGMWKDVAFSAAGIEYHVVGDAAWMNDSQASHIKPSTFGHSDEFVRNGHRGESGNGKNGLMGPGGVAVPQEIAAGD